MVIYQECNAKIIEVLELVAAARNSDNAVVEAQIAPIVKEYG
jgi:hypothetical protein